MAFVATTDLARAREFYGSTLGVEVVEENPYALVCDVGGTMLRVTLVETPAGVGYTVLGWRVGDIAATVDALAGKGVAFTRYEGMGQDERGIWTTPGGDQVAWFTDPDGNVLSLTQFVTA